MLLLLNDIYKAFYKSGKCQNTLIKKDTGCEHIKQQNSDQEYHLFIILWLVSHA